MATPGPARVRLTAGEYVARHGTRTATWRVHQNGDWVSVKDVPGVVLESVSAGPGTVWESIAMLDLEPGAWLLRVEVEPMPERMDDPLSYLEKERRGARRRVSRRFFRVAKDGRLMPARREDAPSPP